MINLNYIGLLSSLHIAKIAGKQAPHKAIMLFNVIDLIETGVITSTHIYYNQQLESQFYHNWIRYVAYLEGYSARAAIPFFHMSYEPFWTLRLKDNCTRTEKNWQT